MIKVEHNTQTGEIIEIQMTAAEVKQAEKESIEATQREQAFNNKITAKAALLDRLGITAEEAALLLG
jgi:hypothetical protein